MKQKDKTIKLFHIPPGVRGHIDDVVREVAGIHKENAPDYSFIYYIAPTASFISRFKDSFHRHAGPCYIPPQAMTINRLCSMLLEKHGGHTLLSSALRPVVISSLSRATMGVASILSGFIKEIKEQFPNEDPAGVKDKLAFHLSRLNIPQEIADRALGACDVYAAYEDALKANGMVDNEGLLAVAPGLIKEHLNDITLIVDGFYEMTKADELIIKALIEKSGFAVINIPISGMDDKLEYCYSNSLREHFNIEPVLINPTSPAPMLGHYPAPSMEEELEAIAKDIKNNYFSGKNRDLGRILIVFPRLAPYREMIERVIRGRYGIPCVISQGKRLIDTRPYQDLLALLNSINDNYPRLRFSTALNSPYFKKIPNSLRQAASLIALNAGMIKGKQAWIAELKKYGADDAGSAIFAVFDRINNADNINTFISISNILLDMLAELVFMPSDDGLAETERLVGKLSILSDILPKTSGIGLSDYIDALSAVLSAETETSVSSPGVMAAELFDVRGMEPDILYMAGLRDGELPSLPEMDYLLPDSIRRGLGLTDITRHMHLQKYIFRRLTESSGTAILSYPSMEGDKFFLPSVFLSDSAKIDLTRRGVYCKAEYQSAEGLRANRQLASHLGKIKGIINWLGGDNPINVTMIDGYRRCPRRFFIEKVVKLKPLEIEEYEADPMQMGTTAHRVMQRLIPMFSFDLAEFKRRADVIIDDVCNAEPMDNYFKRLFKETFLNIVLPEAHEVELELRKEGYVPKLFERDETVEIAEGIKLRGKIDRIDAHESDNSVSVIDYKTGETKINYTDVYERGKGLQLSLYAAMLKSLGYNVRRVGLYSLKDPDTKWIPGKKDKRTIDDYIDSAMGFLIETYKLMKNGDFPASPIDDNACRNCPEIPFCPHMQSRTES